MCYNYSRLIHESAYQAASNPKFLSLADIKTDIKTERKQRTTIDTGRQIGTGQKSPSRSRGHSKPIPGQRREVMVEYLYQYFNALTQRLTDSPASPACLPRREPACSNANSRLLTNMSSIDPARSCGYYPISADTGISYLPTWWYA